MIIGDRISERIDSLVKIFPLVKWIVRYNEFRENIYIKTKPDFNQKIITFVTMKRGSVTDILLNDSNDWGRNNLMSLYSGKKVHSHEWE